MQEVQQIDKNFDKVLDLVSKVENVKVREPLLLLCKEVKSRFAVAPAATKTEFAGAYGGGLVKTSLQVLKAMIQANEALGTNVSSDDLILAGLFFHIGKIGSADKEYYIVQESEWHRNNLGQMFKVNDELGDILPPNIRSIWWLNNAGVPLSEDVIYAITSLSNLTGHQTAYSTDVYKAPSLAILLQTAFRLVCSQASNANKKSVLDA